MDVTLFVPYQVQETLVTWQFSPFHRSHKSYQEILSTKGNHLSSAIIDWSRHWGLSGQRRLLVNSIGLASNWISIKTLLFQFSSNGLTPSFDVKDFSRLMSIVTFYLTSDL